MRKILQQHRDGKGWIIALLGSLAMPQKRRRKLQQKGDVALIIGQLGSLKVLRARGITGMAKILQLRVTRTWITRIGCQEAPKLMGQAN